MQRTTRYQGAIMRGDHILLIRHRHHDNGRTYWLVPGGGREENESEEECVRREMFEETGLDVRVERLILTEDDLPQGLYKQMKTYLCTVLSGEPQPGYEPEEEASRVYAIVEVRWFNLRNPGSWGQEIESDSFTYPLLCQLNILIKNEAG